MELDEKYHFWYGDQIALKRASKDLPYVPISERQVACLPEYYKNQNDVIALHFKGVKRKQLMPSFFDKLSIN